MVLCLLFHFSFLAFNNRNSKTKFSYVLVLLFIGVLAFKLIRDFRSLRRMNSSFINRLSTVFSFSVMEFDNDSTYFTLGKSFKLLPIAIQIRDQVSPFPFYYQLISIMNIILHSFSNYYISWLGYDSYIYSNTSNLFSDHIQNGDVRYGNGTNIIADMYICNNLPTCLIIMVLFGFLIKGCESGFYAKKTTSPRRYCNNSIFFGFNLFGPKQFVPQIEKIFSVMILIGFLNTYYRYEKSRISN